MTTPTGDAVASDAPAERHETPPAPKRTRWILLGVGAVIAVGLVLALRGGGGGGSEKGPGGGGGPGGAAANRKIPVLVEAAAQRDVPIILEGLGTVTPLATVTVTSQVDGRLDSVAFREGQLVKKGELLAQVDPRPFQNQLAQASAALQRDQAQLRNAQRDLLRYQDLRTQNLIPQQQVDTQQTLVEQLQGTVGVGQATVANARLQLDWARITSPIDGVAGIRAVDPGNLVRASTTGLVVLTQLDPISVIFTLPQDALDQISGAMGGAPLPVQVFNRDGQTSLAKGTLTVLDNQINTTTSTLRLRAQFDNPNRLLWPNAFVKARLEVSVRKGALVIPAAAVQRGPSGAFVYVVDAQNAAQMRQVQVDGIEGSVAVIHAGLQPGERVVTEGQSQLKPGATVDPRNAGAGDGAHGGGAGRGGGGAQGAGGPGSGAQGGPPGGKGGAAQPGTRKP